MSISDKNIVAARLKSARKMAGLSQAQVAKILGLHRPAISEIEAGRRKVSAEELSKFAEIYSVDIKWLAGSEPEYQNGEERIHFAARQLAKLKSDDLDKVMNLLDALRPQKGQD
ncbi:MAG: XRE family transcriptional regulator [Planctomycetota bacterium]|nr:MAG: XRE family transcriptional regulator [Planctomycetota bacterium]